MKYAARIESLATSKAECIALPIYDSLDMSASAANLNRISDGQISRILKNGDLRKEVGSTVLIHDVANCDIQRIILFNAGPKAGVTSKKFIVIIKKLIIALQSLSIKSASVSIRDFKCEGRSSEWLIERTIEYFESGTYEYLEMKGISKVERTLLNKINFLCSRELLNAVRAGIKRGKALAGGMQLAKNLANAPGNICTPSYLAKKARQLCRGKTNLSLSVLEERDMKKLGMGAFLAVSQGSDEPGKLVIINYQGARKTKQPHVLVGKGITFDTGGISLKPPPSMPEMIYDMSGAASVLGTLSCIAEQELPINVIGVLAAAENMPSGKATRPGDIIKTMSGQTVEILNTDAEGRLVLCDALTYIDKYKPASVIDVATLTGAIITSLGSVASGLFSNDDQLAEQIISAGEVACDRVWRLPIWEEYQTQIASAFADMANIGGKEAGSITAACYLARFAKAYRWAHLDIAGTAFQGSGPSKGCTGRPVALLCQYLYDQL
ncbi:MAG: leucyl aminopeptidase [Gammaproteobacteria bacterium TMED1]|nr:MAG: leucyl aminopeptidase [Gammaproteobacteria bacterium TMED1]|tara:strand:- start:12810 stop:14297 length:1488 start_codon:yes stop_codon:yes gene_type:complete